MFFFWDWKGSSGKNHKNWRREKNKESFNYFLLATNIVATVNVWEAFSPEASF